MLLLLLLGETRSLVFCHLAICSSSESWLSILQLTSFVLLVALLGRLGLLLLLLLRGLRLASDLGQPLECSRKQVAHLGAF